MFAVFLKGRQIESKRALPGSFFTAVGMIITTWVYMIFVSSASFENFNILYGSLSSVVALLIWFYIIAYIVITGVLVNATQAELETQGKVIESEDS